VISIKYDFPPLARTRVSPSLSLPRGEKRGEERPPRHLRLALLALASPRLLSRFPRSPPSSSSRGGNPGFNPFPYNFLPMHREKLARNTHAHARTAARVPPSLALSPGRSLARSLAVTDY